MRRFAVRAVIVVLLGFIGLLVAFKLKHPKPWTVRDHFVPVDPVAVGATPASTPAERPWIEREGDDVFGRPRRLPDRARLLRALTRHKYAELTTWLEAWQAEFEADHRRENWPAVAVRAFWVSDPKLEPLLDAWAEASPKSWAPIVARGLYRRARSAAARGADVAPGTSGARFAGAAVYADLARKDLQRALELQPKLAIAHEALVAFATPGHGDGGSAAWADAARACPDCANAALLRSTFLVPKWGHPIGELRAFVETMRPTIAKVAALGPLAGAVDAVECDERLIAGDAAGARTACGRALRTGPSVWVLYDRALAERRLEDDAAALADCDRVLELDPQFPGALVLRARLLAPTPRALEALRDLAAAVRIDRLGTKPDVYRDVLSQALTTGQQAEAAGDLTTARAILDAAFAAAPASRMVRKLRETFRREHGLDPAELAAIRARYEAEAPSVSLAADVDDALLVGDDFEGILAIWTRELAAAPNDPRAHLERAGTYARMGRARESADDLAAACRLGLAEACGR